MENLISYVCFYLYILGLLLKFVEDSYKTRSSFVLNFFYPITIPIFLFLIWIKAGLIVDKILK